MGIEFKGKGREYVPEPDVIKKMEEMGLSEEDWGSVTKGLSKEQAKIVEDRMLGQDWDKWLNGWDEEVTLKDGRKESVHRSGWQEDFKEEYGIDKDEVLADEDIENIRRSKILEFAHAYKEMQLSNARKDRREIGGQILKTGVDTISTITGVKSLYSVPTYLKERFQVRGILGAGKGLEGSTEDLLSKNRKMHERIAAGDKERHSEVKEAIDDLNKRLIQTREGKTKGSEQRKMLAQLLMENRRLEKMNKEQRHQEITKILDDYTTTKTTGYQAARDSLNTFFTYASAGMLRGVSYGVMDGVERFQNLRREDRQKGVKKNVFSTLKDTVIGGIKKTWQELRLKDESGKKSKKQKVIESAAAAGKVARYASMIAGIEYNPSSVNHSIDNALKALRGQVSLSEGAQNFLGNIERQYEFFKGLPKRVAAGTEYLGGQVASGVSSVGNKINNLAGVDQPTAGNGIERVEVGGDTDADEHVQIEVVEAEGQESLESEDEDVNKNLFPPQQSEVDYITQGLYEKMIDEDIAKLDATVDPAERQKLLQEIAALNKNLGGQFALPEDVKSEVETLQQAAADLSSGQSKIVSEEEVKTALIHKGDGVEHVFRRQLESAPDKFGFKGDINDKAAVSKWSGSEAHRIAVNNGYVDQGTKQEIRVGTKGIEQAAYILRADADGNITVDEAFKTEDGFKVIESHDKGQAFEGKAHEEYEYAHKGSHKIPVAPTSKDIDLNVKSQSEIAYERAFEDTSRVVSEKAIDDMKSMFGENWKSGGTQNINEALAEKHSAWKFWNRGNAESQNRLLEMTETVKPLEDESVYQFVNRYEREIFLSTASENNIVAIDKASHILNIFHDGHIQSLKIPEGVSVEELNPMQGEATDLIIKHKGETEIGRLIYNNEGKLMFDFKDGARDREINEVLSVISGERKGITLEEYKKMSDRQWQQVLKRFKTPSGKVSIERVEIEGK